MVQDLERPWLTSLFSLVSTWIHLLQILLYCNISSALVVALGQLLIQYYRVGAPHDGGCKEWPKYKALCVRVGVCLSVWVPHLASLRANHCKSWEIGRKNQRQINCTNAAAAQKLQIGRKIKSRKENRPRTDRQTDMGPSHFT